MAKQSLTVIPGAKVIPVDGDIEDRYGFRAAKLLQQIHFWCQKQPNHRDGYDWHYNTYDAWAKQIGCSARTVRRVVKELKDDGVLVIGNYNKLAFDQTQWYRIDYAVLNTSIGTPGPHPSGQNAPMEASILSAPIPEITQENTQQSTCDTFVASLPHLVATTGNNKKNGKTHEESKESKKKEKEEKEMKLEEILKKGGKTAPMKNYGAIWQKAVSEVQNGAIQPPLTQKQTGQLKMAVTKLGMNAEQVIIWAVINWGQFTLEATSSAGTTHAPDEPIIGYFLQHHGVAMNLWLQSIAKAELQAKIQAEQAKYQNESSKKVSVPAPEVPYKPTPEEIQEVLDYFKN